ncbi:PEP-CTERM sorting domain-containing protein [Microcystis aeruginosa]|uniref:PEP-CTERM sorting domain-containing protein n=1 Tax=Microcystis aeruginosa 11-30S32 TaxID=2358142 RepID=A0A510PGF7_MICAE|nr:PEP-CTERM sorting domain-containing protein [Microcystis aeruginosa]GCA92866.1 hypothetical protein OA58_11460 [Microcystis aeruginosa 11-30S32]
MNSLKPHQLGKVVAIATIATAFSSLGLVKAEAATLNTLNGFFASNTPITVTGTFSLFAHPSQSAPALNTIGVGTPLALSASLGSGEIHGTTGSGSITGTWGIDPASGAAGLLWTMVANIAPGPGPFLPVSFTTAATFSNGVSSSAGSVTANGIEVIPEPSSILGIITLGTLGAASTLKRKLKPCQSTEKETTKVG